MHPKKVIACIYLFIFSTINTIDPLSLIAAPIVKELWDYAKEYWYYNQKHQERILKKHLHSPTFYSGILEGCNANFTNDCIKLAQYLEAMEKYYTKHTELKNLIFQKEFLKETKDTTALEQKIDQLRKELTDENSNISFFQSLSSDKQDELLTLERNIVMEYTNPGDAQQEIHHLHAMFDQNNSFTS